MNDASAARCPMHDNIDRRKSAKIAAENTHPDPGSHWVQGGEMARSILRNKQAVQAGAGAESLTYDNPEHAPVFFLNGEDHFNKRRKTQRFLSPKAVTEQHYKIMEKITGELLGKFRQQGQAKLEDISFQLAIEVVGEILGLTESDQAARARRIQRVLYASIASHKPGLAGKLLNLKRAFHTGVFFLFDVRPAIQARRKAPREDAISFYLDEGYSNLSIVIECLTYGTAGMLTTREFIVMAAWYLFENAELRERFLGGDMKEQMAILMEILRLEPVAAKVQRRVHEEVSGLGDKPLPAGELYGIDIRAANIDEAIVGECPFALDPERAKRVRDTGRYLSFSDGPHNCPGWQVALHETRIFLAELFRLPGLRLEREPDISWNPSLGSYELRNAEISCDPA
ncbi:cytochrome P450 [Mangrovimicrobium sediminis]|uniref:Cytochrome P450 n=1 Tax=Mangrovimicrobium sediminis TaxID=2562682 RepID=A0A4Z0LXX5_9GAMM|nr:cytochrome P450 [Haliea sp. SAOS-164]TGD72131.1 cytochrome P450 [Haliea sp. SAOS-164]